MSDARTVVADPALGFSYQIVLDKDARRTLVFQGHVSISASVNEINAIVDKAASAADRQIAVYELRQAEEDLAGHKLRVESLQRQLYNMEELSKARWEVEKGDNPRRGEWSPNKMSADEKAAYKNIPLSIEKYHEGIRRCEDTIARCLPLVNGYASDLSTDSSTG